MSAAVHYSFLELAWIRAVFEHVQVIIRFYDHGVGLGRKGGSLFGNVAEVCHYHEFVLTKQYGIANGLCGIVGQFEPACLDLAGYDFVPAVLQGAGTVVVMFARIVFACYGPSHPCRAPHRVRQVLAI